MIRNRGIPPLFSYSEAVIHEEKIEPRKADGVKPLGHRSYKWIAIRKEAEDVVVSWHVPYVKPEDMICHDLVRYRPNGEIVITLPYCDQSMHFVIRALLNVGMIRYDNRSWLLWNPDNREPHNWWSGMRRTALLRLGGEENIIRITGTQLRYVNPPVTTIHQLDKKKTKEVKRLYKPFYDYVLSLLKLMNGEPIQRNAIRLWPAPNHIDMIRSNDQEQWATVLAELANVPFWWSMARFQLDPAEKVTRTRSLYYKRINKIIYRAHAAEVLVEVPATDQNNFVQDKYRNWL